MQLYFKTIFFKPSLKIMVNLNVSPLEHMNLSAFDKLQNLLTSSTGEKGNAKTVSDYYVIST